MACFENDAFKASLFFYYETDEYGNINLQRYRYNPYGDGACRGSRSAD